MRRGCTGRGEERAAAEHLLYRSAASRSGWCHRSIKLWSHRFEWNFFFFFLKRKRSGERTAQLVFLSCALFYIHTWHKLWPRNRFERKLNSTWNGNNLNKGLHTQTKGLKNTFKEKRASSIEKDESLWGVTGNVNKYIFVSIFIHFLNRFSWRSGWQGGPEPSWRFVTG